MATKAKFPELDEALGKIQERRAKLAQVFAEAGETIDMSQVKVFGDMDTTAKVGEVRKLNLEIDELQTKIEDLTVLKTGQEYSQAHDDEGQGNGRLEKGRFSPEMVKTIGQLYTESESNIRKQVKFDLDIELKTLLSTTAGWAPQVTRGPRLVDFATITPTLVDIIPTVPTDQAGVKYMEETTFTNAAAETGEGLVKPEAALAFTERLVSISKIAVFLPVTDEQLEDVPRIQAILDNRLGFMVRQRLGSQILVGTGAGVTIRGFLNVVGIQTQAKGADPGPDAVYKAMVKIMTTGEAMPDAAVFNPLDWQDIRLLRTVDGIYIWGSPSDAGPERIWGLPVVLDQGLTQNTALVGAFRTFSELDVKRGLTVETGYNLDDWTKNLQTIRAEMRAALVVYRPAAFCTVTGM